MEPHHHPSSLPPPFERGAGRFPPAHVFYDLSPQDQQLQLRRLRQLLLSPHRTDRARGVEAASSHARDPVIYSALAQELLLHGAGGGVRQDFHLRVAYASALSGASDIPFVRRALYQVLTRPDPNWEVRAATIAALLTPVRAGAGLLRPAHLQALTPLLYYRDANIEVQQVLMKHLRALQLTPNTPAIPARQLRHYLSVTRAPCAPHRHILELLADHHVEEAARAHEDAFELHRNHVLERYPDDLYSDETLAAAVRSYRLSTATTIHMQRVLLVPLEETIEALARGRTPTIPDLLPVLQFICDAELIGLRDDVRRVVEALKLSGGPLARPAMNIQADFELHIAEQQRLHEVAARKHASEIATQGLGHHLRNTEHPIDSLLDALQHIERAVAFHCLPETAVRRLGEALVQLIQQRPMAAIEFLEQRAPHLTVGLRAVCKIALSRHVSGEPWLEAALAQLGPLGACNDSAIAAFREWATRRASHIDHTQRQIKFREDVARSIRHLTSGVRSTPEPGRSACEALTCIDNALVGRAALRSPRQDVARVVGFLLDYDRHYQTKEFEQCCTWLFQSGSRALQELVYLALETLHPEQVCRDALQRFHEIRVAQRTPPGSEH